MTNFRIDISGDKTVREALRRGGSTILRYVDDALGRGGIELTREARRRAAKGRGDLRGGIQSRRLSLADYVVEARVRNVAGKNYAPYVERGTGPGGWPSLMALVDWMRVRGVASQSQSPERLARAIQWSIFRRGTPAQPYMRPALGAKRERIVELVRQAAIRGARESMG